MKSKKLTPETATPKQNRTWLGIEFFNKLWDDVFGGTGAISAASADISGTVSVDTISEHTSGSGVTIDGVLIKDGTITTTAPLINSVDAAITAHAGGTQAAAYQLTEEINVVTVCATAADSVKLPSAVVGLKITVANLGVAALYVYASDASAQTIDDQAAGGYVIVKPEQVVQFDCYTTTKWQSNFEAEGAYDKVYVDTIAEHTAATGVTIDSVLLKDGYVSASAGTAAAPAYTFATDPNSGIYSISDNVLGFATNGAEKWRLSGGDIIPAASNYDIGSSAVPVFRIFAASTQATGAAFGAAGIVDATLSATHYTTGKDVVTVLTLTDYIIGPLAGAAAAKVLVPANAIFTFPAGAHALYLTSYSLALTATGTAVTPDVSIASAAGDGSANATMNLSAGNGEDIVTGTAIADTVTHAVVSVGPVGVVAGVLTGIGLNAIGGVKTVYLNAAATWNADNTGNLTATGTIRIKWSIL